MAEGQPCPSALGSPTQGAAGRTLRGGPGWGSGLRKLRPECAALDHPRAPRRSACQTTGRGAAFGGRGASCGLSLFLNYKKTGNRARERAKFKGGSGSPGGQTPGRPPARWEGRGCRVRDERSGRVGADDGWLAWNPATPQICSPSTQATEKPKGGWGGGGRAAALRQFLPLLAPEPPAGSDSTSSPRRARTVPGSRSESPSPPRAAQPAAPAASADSSGWNRRGRPPCLQPLPSAAPRPQPCSRAAARTAFPFPGFNHVTSPLGRPESVPVALYVKSQFLTLSTRILPHGPPSCPPHLGASSAELRLRFCKTE